MKAGAVFLAVIVLLGLISATLSSESLARGWGDDIFDTALFYSTHTQTIIPLPFARAHSRTLIITLHISWHTLDEARSLSKENGKPIMLIIHKTWCGACKRLKPDFAGSSDIKKLSSDFIMVNVQDDEEPADDEFKQDGGYIPRIFYLDPKTQKVRPDIYNKAGSDKYKYFYADASAVLSGMKGAISAFKA